MDIVFFSAVGYDSIIGGRTRRLCDELAQRHCIHFIEMPSLRKPCFCGKRKISDHLYCYRLMPMPRLWNHFDTCYGKFWVDRISDFLSQHLPSDVRIIVSTPFWIPVLRKLKFRSVVYDCLDHLSVQAPGAIAATAGKFERELLTMADQVICVSETLAASMRERTAQPVHFINNGFPSGYLQRDVLYPEQPTAGFCGAMYEWFDFDLIRDAASALPDIHFILTGPVRDKNDLKPLYRLSNIEIRAAVPFAQVADEVQCYSVGMIPFKRDEVSYYCNPLKMYEYLALGKNVVSTVCGANDIPVLYADDDRCFIEMLDHHARAPEEIKIDRNRLTEHSWNNIAKKIERILE